MATTTKSDLSVTTTEHPNVGRTRAAFDAFARGDLDTVRASMTDDCVWTNNGTSPIAGTFRGWGEISSMFGTLLEMTGGTFSMDVISCLADDKHSATIYDATSTANGITVTARYCLIDEMTAEGKTKATHVLAYDQEAADRQFAG